MSGPGTPNYATNAPQGYMGDWKRGAPLGRPYIGPDVRTVAQLESDFVTACTRLDLALRLKERRPADGFKPPYWQAAADAAREEKETLRALFKAAKARETAPGPKITLRRVRFNSGGYDSCGAYWGLGAPLYWAADDSGDYDSTFRADDRDDAKAIVRETFPNATFHR